MTLPLTAADRATDVFGVEDRLDRVFAAIAGVPERPEWMSLRHVVSPGFAEVGHLRARTPGEVRTLGEVMARTVASPIPSHEQAWVTNGVRLVSPWTAAESEMRVRAARLFDGPNWPVAALLLEAGVSPYTAEQALLRERLSRRDVATGFDSAQWADLAVCLRAGMHTQAAVGHVRSGADMDPVRLLAALTG